MILYTPCADKIPLDISLVTLWLNAGSKVLSFDRDIKRKLKLLLEVNSACDVSSSMSLDASPKFTDTRTSKPYVELLADIILRPH